VAVLGDSQKLGLSERTLVVVARGGGDDLGGGDATGALFLHKQDGAEAAAAEPGKLMVSP
jgi:hypothetical protein